MKKWIFWWKAIFFFNLKKEYLFWINNVDFVKHEYLFCMNDLKKKNHLFEYIFWFKFARAKNFRQKMFLTHLK